ncbi:hypothetical protein CLV51_103404 [Chitinophaga niastensis]|uniref:Tetratricopeptide repeat protein n=1 Tax=Chitinophaga niastensis TaxID=536980 RepID=A0A2P8HJM8_CHINA|nr:hypothetical protein [Chitinophaga niastensis]PSL46426.1 hypothetical protein CLV51_103404 [Chitinophaga niastensis]
MELATFMTSLKEDHPPKGSSVYLQALWLDKKGNWTAAHDLIDNLPGRDAARLHAYLHRAEGDEGNASYWYNKAGEKKPAYDLEKEWEILLEKFLSFSRLD